jgi:hypothetical protein
MARDCKSVYGSALERKNRHSFAARLCALRLKRNLLMFALEYFMRENNNCAPPSVMPTQGGIYLINRESLSEHQKPN